VSDTARVSVTSTTYRLRLALTSSEIDSPSETVAAAPAAAETSSLILSESVTDTNSTVSRPCTASDRARVSVTSTTYGFRLALTSSEIDSPSETVAAAPDAAETSSLILSESVTDTS